jgi:dTDP-4-amino-4,6-dideoxygalactose transaminase
MNIPFVDLQAQYQSIKAGITVALADVLDQGDFVLGRAVGEFEAAFATYCETSFAVGVDSGYSALELILRAYAIGPGDEVITATNTFVATALAINACGARTVLVDCNPDTYTLDPQGLEAAITPATRAIIVVHLYGQCADMDPILAIARRHGLRVIEDACQAHGARYNGRRAGGLADAAAFSFYPSKNLGAYGDGGAVTTNDPELTDHIRLLRNLGQRARYRHEIKGYNHRLDTLQAAVLMAKLPYLDSWNTARRRAADDYRAALSDLPIDLPYVAPHGDHVYHLYVVRVPDRADLQAHLGQAGIATAIHYPLPLHLQPAFQELGYGRGAFPVAEAYMEQILSLPIYPEIELEKIERVAVSIREFESYHRVRG